MLVGRREALSRVPDRPDRPSPDGGPVGLILTLLDRWKLLEGVWSTWIAFVDSISASTHRTGVGISDCRATRGHSPQNPVPRGSENKNPIVIVGCHRLYRLRFGVHRLYRTPMAKAVLFGQNGSFEFRPPKHPNRCSQHSKRPKFSA